MWLFLSGVFVGVISGNGKRLVPAVVDQSFVFQGSCCFLASVLLSVGLFLSLYGLFSQSGIRRRFVWPCLCNLGAIVLALSSYFSGYVQVAHASQTAQSIEVEPKGLPKLIETIGAVDSEKAKITIAKGVYQLYGVRLAYRAQDGQIVYYEPDAQEVSSRQEMDQLNVEALKIKNTWLDKIQRALTYLPYFFTIYLGTFFLTFFIGTLWVAFKKPKLEPNLQS